jgi:hypothetical protein
MGGACSRYGDEERCVRGIGEELYLEELGVDGRIILQCILKKQDGRT